MLISAISYVVYRNNGFIGRLGPEYAEANIGKQWEEDFAQPCSKQFKDLAGVLKCRMSNTASHPQVLILGDSHADAVAYGLMRKLESQNRASVTIGNMGCPLLLLNEEQVKIFNNSEIRRCLPDYNKMFLNKENWHGIQTVVLGSRWAYHMRKNFVTEELMNSGVKRLVDLLQDMGMKIIILKEIPEANEPYRCIRNRPILFSEFKRNPEHCFYPKAGVQEMHERYLKVFANMKFKEPVKFIDLEEHFCEGEYCSPYKDGRVLYRDNDHLGKFGSDYMAKFIDL
jgi:hypothetical protein